MPPLRGLRARKRWRYVGAYGPELMLCVGFARIGPVPQSFWALWDRESRVLRERTRTGRGGVRLSRGRVVVRDAGLELELTFDEQPGIEVVTPDGSGYAWTRKQGDVQMRGALAIDGVPRRLELRGIVDDSAGYHARHTAWSWSAGVGTTADGQSIAWNLVEGIHDSTTASERTIWLDGEPSEPAPVRFAPDLSAIELGGGGSLRFSSEAVRERHDDFVLFRSDYVQPFGTFSGELPSAGALREGYGVMERHDVRW